MTASKQQRKRPLRAPDAIDGAVAQFSALAFGGRSRQWLDRPHDATSSAWAAINNVVKFLGGEARPIANLDVVALEMIDGDDMRGSALLVVDLHGRTRTGVVSWTRSVVTGVSGAQLYLHAPRAMRRLATLLARDVVGLALAG